MSYDNFSMGRKYRVLLALVLLLVAGILVVGIKKTWDKTLVSRKWAELLTSKYPFDKGMKEGIIRDGAKTIWVYGRAAVTELSVGAKGYLTVENKYGKFTGKVMRKASSVTDGGESELSRLGIDVGDLIRVKMTNDANFPVVLEVRLDK